MTYSVQHRVRITDDDEGFWWEVIPDRDGLGCIEILYCDGELDDPVTSLGVFPPGAARLIGNAMNEIADHIATEEAKR